jgi:hypothetical protein
LFLFILSIKNKMTRKRSNITLRPLATFFKVIRNGREVEPLRTYFECDFEKMKTRWLLKKPKPEIEDSKPDIKYISTWKGATYKGYNINVSGYYEKDHREFEFPVELEYKNISALKSQLQKCVRRQETELAIQTAWIIMKLDFEEFIRRIVIIMIEDVYIHPSVFPILVWITSGYTHGYKPSLKIVAWLLGVVEMLCETELYDPFLFNEKFDKEFKYSDIQTHKLNSEEINFMYCLLFRVSFGGMTNDVIMMNNSLYEWMERLVEEKMKLDSVELNPEINYVLPPILEGDKIRREHMLINGFDFHCNPSILDKLKERLEMINGKTGKIDSKNISTKSIKRAIWLYNSCWNTHSQIFDDKIERHVERQKYRYEKETVIKVIWDMICDDYHVKAFRDLVDL